MSARLFAAAVPLLASALLGGCGAAAPSTYSATSITLGPDGALWVTEQGAYASAIGRIAPTGSVTQFSLCGDLDASDPGGIAVSPDGRVWFVGGGTEVGQMTTNGKVSHGPILGNENQQVAATVAASDGAFWVATTLYPDGPSTVERITSSGDPFIVSRAWYPGALAAGDNGDVWVLELKDGRGYGVSIGGARLAHITADGAVTELPDLPGPRGYTASSGIARDDAGNLWVAGGTDSPSLVRVAPAGHSSVYRLPHTAGLIENVITGPAHTIWFTDTGTGEPRPTRLGRLAIDTGSVKEFDLPSEFPSQLVLGGDNNIWYLVGTTDAGVIGRVTPSGLVTELPLPVDAGC